MDHRDSPLSGLGRAGSESPTELLVKQIAAGALDSTGGSFYRDALGRVGCVDEPSAQLRIVRLLGRGVLTADVAAVQAVETAIAGRSNDDRARIIATLGRLSAAAGHTTDATIEPLLRNSARECNLAVPLVRAARSKIATRQTSHEFIKWVTVEPASFSHWVWAASLRAAGERVWDRSWGKIAERLDGGSRISVTSNRGDDRRSGWVPFDISATSARRAGVDALIAAALSEDHSRRAQAWREAMRQAELARGSFTWAGFANEVRAAMGPTTWTTTNHVIGTQVAVIINDLPYIAGYLGMIALAAEAATAPVRAAVMCVGARATNGRRNIDDAVSAAIAGSADVLGLSA